MSHLERSDSPHMPEGNRGEAHPTSWERSMLNNLLTASLKEQRSARHWKIFFRFFWTALLLFYFGFLFFSVKGGKDSLATTEHVAVVDIRGAIMSGKEASAKEINKILQKAFTNEASRAIVLRINSPGGSPVQAEMIYDEIKRLKVKYKKPVYAAIEDTGASAAYYIAAAADEIYVSRSALVGSIGVLTNQFGFVELLDKVGVERRLVTSGGHKGMMDPFLPLKPGDQEFMENMLNKVHQTFIEAVKDGRGSRLKIDDDTFSGLFWTGTEAVERGLADGLGTVESIARDIVKVPRLVDYKPELNLLGTITRELSASIGDATVDAMNNSALEIR